MQTQIKARFNHFIKQDILKLITTSVKQQWSSTETTISYFILIFIATSLLSNLANLFFFHYDTPKLTRFTFDVLPGIFILYCLCMLMQTKYTYLGNLGIGISQVGLFFCSMALGSQILLANPFTMNLIDPILLHWDQLLGFNQASLLQWAHQSHLFPALLSMYNTWIPQCIATPLIVTLFCGYREKNIWLIAFLICEVIGGLIFYCLPSLPPAANISHPFLSVSYQLTNRFYIIHQHLPPVVGNNKVEIGLVVFPSFHVIGATLNTTTCWYYLFVMKQRALLRTLFLMICISLTALNIGLIFSTVALGMHYLVDVICSIIIVAVGFWAARHFVSDSQWQSKRAT